MKAITPHYIDGKFVEPHGRDVMDALNPTNNTVIGSVTLADEEDARRAIAAAKRAFASFWWNVKGRAYYCSAWVARSSDRSDS